MNKVLLLSLMVIGCQ